MKKLLLIAFLVILTSALVFSGCSQSASAPSSAAKSAPASPPAASPAAGKTIELKLAHWMATDFPLHVQVFVPLAKELEEKTQGRVKLTIYPSSALGPATELFNLTIGGTTDLAYYLPSYSPGKFPLTSALELPFICGTANESTGLINSIYTKYLQDEYKDVKLLQIFVSSASQLQLAKKSVHTLADLKGLKIRTPGAVASDILKTLGATPVTIPYPEIYSAQEKGTIDGSLIGFGALSSMKLVEVTKYSTDINITANPMVVFMNLKTFNSLSPNDQKVLVDLWSQYTMKSADSFQNDDDGAKKMALGKGNEIYKLPSAEYQKWVDTVKPMYDKWTSDIESKGLPGKKIFDDVFAGAQKFAK